MRESRGSRIKKSTEQNRKDDTQGSPDREGFPIVGIGASAGGLEAVERLLRSLPASTGMAFILVQHLDPKHESRLTEILSRATTMPVTEVRDGMRVLPNHVYIIPPNTNMQIREEELHLEPRKDARALYMPINLFFGSLAESHRNRAIGVILSGTASDGVAGMKEIKKNGGITFAQDASSAKYSGMPQSSIASGAVDFTFPPEQIAEYLSRIAHHTYVKQVEPEGKEAPAPPEGDPQLNQLFRLLQKNFGVDFSTYKPSTVNRRIRRRMALQGIESLGEYVRYVQDKPEELRVLYQDMFIGITSFFREPEAFRSLQKLVFPRILQNSSADSPIRIWVPGCSTGEEVYSLTIALLEFLGNKAGNIPIQIFGTDINEEAIVKARHGNYLEDIARDVGRSRLRRFFVKTEGGYQVNKIVRDLCIFSKHDITRDPPFSRLSLVSCRNVLIYLGADLQRKLIPLLHYTLRPSGFLLLGSAESIGGSTELFRLLDRKHKIYEKKPGPPRTFFDFSVDRIQGLPLMEGNRIPKPPRPSLDLQKEAADLIILNEYAPPSALVDENGEILHFRGHTGPFLEPAPGTASLNILKMARPGLLVGLRHALSTATKKNIATQVGGLVADFGGREKSVSVHVVPVTSPGNKQRTYLVLFEDVSGIPPDRHGKGTTRLSKTAAQKEDGGRIGLLKQELTATKNYLQSVIENQEASNEELRSLNEEIMSTNEELQSTTEELETANEELQSANEELSTLNDELHHRNEELSRANNDIVNLLSSMNLSIVIVNRELKIRRYTPTAEKVLNLIPPDIGRPLTDIRLNVEIPELGELLIHAMDEAKDSERKVQDREGRWYSLAVRPYITAENKIDGAVLALTDIHELTVRSLQLEKANQELREAEGRFRSFVDAAPDAMIISDPKGIISLVNVQAENMFGYGRDEMMGQPVDILIPDWLVEEYRSHFDAYVKDPQLVTLGLHDVVYAKHKERGQFPAEVRLSPIRTAEGMLVAGTIRDLTQRTELEKQNRQLAILQERTRLAGEVHDTIAQGLTGIVLCLEQAEKSRIEEPQEADKLISRCVCLARENLEQARRSVRFMHPLLLDGSDLHTAIKLLADKVTSDTPLQVKLQVSGKPRKLASEAEQKLLRICQEALANVVRHARATEARVALSYKSESIQLVVEDNGEGFALEEAQAGGGIGLSIMKQRAAEINAQLSVDSAPGKGTRVEVVLPDTADHPGGSVP